MDELKDREAGRSVMQGVVAGPVQDVRDHRSNPHVWHDWCAHAVGLPGKALHLAMMLSVLGRRTSSSGVRPTRRTMKAWAISRDACYDGLERLETAGLVHVWRLPGRTPMVIMVDPATRLPLLAVKK